MLAALRFSQALDRFVRAIARAASWLFLAMVAVICVDVLTRKLNARLPYFDSTRLQELEWHFHGILFLLCLGYGYVRNAHVRIDVVSAHFSSRTTAWMELVGCLLLALPFCLAIIIIGTSYFHQSLLQNEMSEAPTGLPYRWIIKGMIPLGMVLLLLAVISIALRQIVSLFGPDDLQDLRTRSIGVQAGGSGDR